MYITVSPFTQSFDDIWFTYEVPENLCDKISFWIIVNVPFWKKIIQALVLDIYNETTFDKSKIKKIESIFLETIFLSYYQVLLLKWISNYYFTLIHNSLNLFFPKNLLWKVLNNKFIFSKNKDFIYNFNYNKKLNISQQNIYEDIIKSDTNKFLLYWVTWSWKTEVYINLINYYLKNNKQSLLLVPEIILTNQIFDRIKKVFWENVIIINSTVSDAKKTLYWEYIFSWVAKVIIWTRSSLFYPYNDLWIIIIDEEHDNSYISDNSPRYDSIEVANFITNINKNKLLLSSWTPKINHYYNCLKKDFKVLNLFNEFF